MAQSFRIAFGPCSCVDRKPNNVLVGLLCQEVQERLERLGRLTYEQLLAHPVEQFEKIAILKHRAGISVIREELSDGNLLVVVRALVATWRWPTWLSTEVVGHVVSEGLVCSPEGKISPAPKYLMWRYR